MITLDTSAVLALLDRRDASHQQIAAVVREARGPLVLPVPVIAEMTYMLEARIGLAAAAAFVAKLAEGAFVLDCCEDDYGRASELMGRYADLRLPFTDAAVVACAERNGRALLTLDRRDFDIVARGEGTFDLLP